jgi:hypothetical protein
MGLSPKEEDKIFRIIDRVLNQIFGEAATTLIYKHLERCYSLRQEEFSDKIDVFAKGLEEFLSSGAYMVENKILNDICSTYGLESSIDSRTGISEECNFASQMKTVIQNA